MNAVTAKMFVELVEAQHNSFELDSDPVTGFANFGSAVAELVKCWKKNATEAEVEEFDRLLTTPSETGESM